jgi:DNA invertase Pin-like site-specific DNA recombinase
MKEIDINKVDELLKKYKLYTYNEYAKIKNISLKTIYNHLKTGQLESCLIAGKKYIAKNKK